MLVRKDVHAEDRRYVHSYRPGDSLRFHTSLPSLSIKAGQLANVIDAQPDTGQLSIKIDDGVSPRFINYDPKRRSNVSIFESQNRTLGVGDTIQFTTPWKEKGIASRETAVIEQISAGGQLSARLNDNRCISWNLKDFNHVDYAYAMTSHSSQGMTVDRVLIQVDTNDSRVRGLVDNTLSYVATSRARYDAQIFTDNAQLLGRSLSKSNAKDTALNEVQVQSYVATQGIA